LNLGAQGFEASRDAAGAGQGGDRENRDHHQETQDEQTDDDLHP
jgi:hypothetical protein